ncbi:hypothetical protein GCM10011608_43170 [Micromonospora sonchi]|uniref:Uncharacterized protein n=1 Tax=Micromonospora sonchi TaxID=1763543 RepID=A0A917U2L1_9ACTN|nr:hypothetical protein [Micromonospora sonchi]GGM53642.1 hypothetical protein GCM10011608_43170 [Micromonospora sonchi]
MQFLKHMTTFLQGLSRSRRAVGGVLALLTAAVVVLAAPSPAMASENYANICEVSYASCQTGVQAGLVEGQCMTANATSHYTQVCVKYDGDYVYVRDGQADGHAAVAEISGGNGDIRNRFCRNPYGYGTWAKCNFNWTESGTKWVAGGYFANRNQFIANSLWRFSDN